MATDLGGMTFSFPIADEDDAAWRDAEFKSLPSDPHLRMSMILLERTGRLEAEAQLAECRAEAALIAYYKLEIKKLKRQLYGPRSGDLLRASPAGGPHLSQRSRPSLTARNERSL